MVVRQVVLHDADSTIGKYCIVFNVVASGDLSHCHTQACLKFFKQEVGHGCCNC